MTKFNTVEEQNEELLKEGLAGYDRAINLTFRDRKKVFFSVSYGTHGHGTQKPYFSTTAQELNFHRTDYNRCGQGQNDLLKNMVLKNFFKKWDEKHLEVLTIEEMNELENDLKNLKNKVPYIVGSRFYDEVKLDRELSK